MSHLSCHLFIYVDCLSQQYSFNGYFLILLQTSSSIKTSWYIFWRCASSIKYKQSLSLIVLYALVCRPETPKVLLSGKMPSVAATPEPVHVHTGQHGGLQPCQLFSYCQQPNPFYLLDCGFRRVSCSYVLLTSSNMILCYLSPLLACLLSLITVPHAFLSYSTTTPETDPDLQVLAHRPISHPAPTD